MKKLVLAALILGSCTAAFAQKKNVVSAYNFMRKGELDKAWEYMEPALTSETTSNDPKTWKYNGDLMFKIATSQDLDFKFLVEEPYEKAKESYAKARKLENDVKGKYSSEIAKEVNLYKTITYQRGTEAYNKQQYLNALQMFATAAQVAPLAGNIDTSAHFNTALCAQLAVGQLNDSLSAEEKGTAETKATFAQLDSIAISNYKVCAANNYGGAGVYQSLSNLLQVNGKKDEARKYLEEGISKFPSEPALLIDLVNYHINNKSLGEAKKYIELALQADAKQKVLWFNLAVINRELKDFDGADIALTKALEIDPAYFDAVYERGGIRYNEGAEMNNEANELDFRTKSKEIDALQAKAKVKFEEALPFLEKALEMKPDEAGVQATLLQLYGRLGKTDKYNKLKEKMAK